MLQRIDRKRLIGGAVCVALFAALALTVDRLVRERLARDFAGDADAALDLYVEMTQGWLDRYRALSPIYARHPAVVATLQAAATPGDIARVNAELEVWNAAAGTDVTYIIDAEGRTLAASNWSEPDSFIGETFAYRPYFAQAMDGRLGRFFGLGTTSGKRGYYFAAPVRDGGAPIGVVVTKVAIDEIEQDFRVSPHEVFVTDRSGIVALAGDPAYVLTALAPITEADRLRIGADRQFDLAEVGATPIEPARRDYGIGLALVRAQADRGGAPGATFAHFSAPMNVEQWVLHLLVDIRPLDARIWFYRLFGAALILAAAMLSAVVLQRRLRLVERLRDRERVQATLERRVAARTAALSEANRRLEREVEERAAAEAELRRTQSDLVQAGKLAALGQMSAALSHEFNQPLTAIRTYAENAIAFVAAGSQERATETLSRVLRLTERMAQLSKHLTGFARRSQDRIETVALAAALDEALALLEGRIARAGARVRCEGRVAVDVMGGQVRLQHVLMNLIGNALDAVPETRRPEIGIAVTAGEDEVEIEVRDNGTGIAPEALPRIFDPFYTTKEVGRGRGLGLGLSISFNIVRDFGGTLRAENRPEGGARFVVTLRRAPAAATRTAAE